jgi:cytochrome c oxidase subunit 3
MRINNFFLLKNKHQHPFHLVNSSLWPISLSFSLLNFFLILIAYFNYFALASITWDLVFISWTIYSPIFYFLIFFFFFTQWMLDIIRESTFEGYHTFAVQIGLYYGMILFIISEIMFFFSFFWAFFHTSLSPNIYIGYIWPPLYINILDPFSLPLWNTVILLSSGVTITYAHKSILVGDRYTSLDGLIWTILYGIIFTFIQGYEYCFSSYSINDGIFGSLFFLLTGFHGIHVLIGTLFLIVCFFRQLEYHFTRQHHLGLEVSILYWHMVDLIWLFLFVCVYL